MAKQSSLPSPLLLFLALPLGGCAYEMSPAEATTSSGVEDLSAAYSVGGTLEGMKGSGLVLQNNGTDDIAVGTDGIFRFPATVANGAAYNVTVSLQPTSPAMKCVVQNGSGTIKSADATDAQVRCTLAEFAVGGHVDGLDAVGLVLANGKEEIALSKSGDFVFFDDVEVGNAYAVTIAQQPEGATCTVSGGAGTMGIANAMGAAVTCAAN
jgi:hypothetical protein